MTLGEIRLENYGSWGNLTFDYSNLGLTLISGHTKAGKSTLLDAPGWVIFGKTSKDLNADDVKSWFAAGPTLGSISLHLNGRIILVTRIRGIRPTQNDFYYQIGGSDTTNWTDAPMVRGKDAVDTQKLLNAEIGIDADLYFAGSYMHQFAGDGFFTAKAEMRRQSMEKIANLSLAIKLGQKASESRKDAKKVLDGQLQSAAKLQGKEEALDSALISQTKSEAAWEERWKADRLLLEEKCSKFEEEKEANVYKLVEQLEVLDQTIKPEDDFPKRAEQLRDQIKSLDSLDEKLTKINNELSSKQTARLLKTKEYGKYSELGETCHVCLGPTRNPNRDQHLENLMIEINDLNTEIKSIKSEAVRLTEALIVKPKLQDKLQKIALEQAENKRLIDKFETIRAQALALKDRLNPYTEQLIYFDNAINPHFAELIETRQKIDILKEVIAQNMAETKATEKKIFSLTWLYDKSYELRGLFLSKAVRQINSTTNRILERYFDAALRADFVLSDSDKLEVNLTNEGYPCKYEQLSGGERCMLKFAFNIGYMQAAENTAGIKFQNLMLDETMNGLDAALKIKAFGLLQEIEKNYSSILLIDHAEEFKQLFSNKFVVTKEGAYSSIVPDSI